ncbi:hypothetical protein CVT27_26940 [Streptomyces cavourensis]|nr:hypothetical protein CVT27_26940 [Streptomyces cavourensis]
MLHEIAEVFAQYRQGALRREAAAQAPARELLALAEAERSAAAPLPAALRACGLPERGPYTVMVMATGAEESAEADALREVLRHLAGHRFVTARLAEGRDGGGDRGGGDGGGCGGRCGSGRGGRWGGRYGVGCGGFRFAGRFPEWCGRRAQWTLARAARVRRSDPPVRASAPRPPPRPTSTARCYRPVTR